MKSLLSEYDLEQWLGFQRRADIVRWLERRAIPYEVGAGGRVITTLEAVQERFRTDREEFEFDGPAAEA